jgi:acyl-CoA reductase-like NAD-dependent aldehyde dehydrogenase
MLQATLLENVPEEARICTGEAFGPVAVMNRSRHFGEAPAAVNDSVFGLQAGVFTRDIYKIQRAWDELDVGGVIIGDLPSWRVDNMPYGGVKDSGLGREGVRFAMGDMAEIGNLVIRTARGGSV